MNVFIIGSNGYISKRLVNKIPSEWNINLVSSHPKQDNIFLNLEKPQEFDYSLIKPKDVIILLAAISSPDACEKQFDYAYRINVKGTLEFIKNCINRGGKVLFFSSDTVYGRQDDLVNENSEFNPLGNYALMKRKIEEYFACNKYFKVLRLSYVFSKDDKFTKYLISCSKKRVCAEIYHPLFRNIVYIEDLITAIINIIRQWDEIEETSINICGNELLSRVDLCNMYKELIDKNLEIKVIEPNFKFFDARPKVINMESVYFREILNREPSSIKDAILLEFNKDIHQN